MLTRLRLGRGSGGAGRLHMGRGLVNVHTVAGVLALVVLGRLPGRARGHLPRQLDLRHPLAGVLVGHGGRRAADPGALAPPARPPRLRRAAPTPGRTAPALSILAHVGMLVGVCVFTWAYLTSVRVTRCGPCVSGPPRHRRLLAAGSLVAPSTAAPTYAAPAPADRPAVIERVVIGHSVQGRPITAWHLGEPGKRRVLLIATMHGDEGEPRQILGMPARRPADPRHRPVGGPGLQPRRPGPRHPQERPRRRPQPQLPLPLGRPRRLLRVRAAGGLGARDPGDDEVPAHDQAGADHQLPPAAVRRRHRHQETARSPAGSPTSSTCRASRSPAAASATAR